MNWIEFSRTSQRDDERAREHVACSLFAFASTVESCHWTIWPFSPPLLFLLRLSLMNWTKFSILLLLFLHLGETKNRVIQLICSKFWDRSKSACSSSNNNKTMRSIRMMLRQLWVQWRKGGRVHFIIIIKCINESNDRRQFNCVTILWLYVGLVAEPFVC